MRNWPDAIQAMAAWIEKHITDHTTLTSMARAIGYSPTYCSTQFHRYTGMTLREYTMQRRLYYAAIAIRDTDARLIDIALEYGYASHGGLTAAFRRAYGMSPAEYRHQRRLIHLPLPIPPEQKQGGDFMLTKPNIRVEYIPAHRYLGVFRAAEVDGEAIWRTWSLARTRRAGPFTGASAHTSMALAYRWTTMAWFPRALSW